MHYQLTQNSRMGPADDALDRDLLARAERREPVGYSRARLLSLTTPAFA
jgi:hypothetical protein